MSEFLKRLREPSTHAGLASLASLLVLFGAPATLPQVILQSVGAATALGAIFLPEKTAPAPAPDWEEPVN